jgi:hypothetical protein
MWVKAPLNTVRSWNSMKINNSIAEGSQAAEPPPYHQKPAYAKGILYDRGAVLLLWDFRGLKFLRLASYGELEVSDAWEVSLHRGLGCFNIRNCVASF